jgi:hypothetical protein
MSRIYSAFPPDGIAAHDGLTRKVPDTEDDEEEEDRKKDDEGENARGVAGNCGVHIGAGVGCGSAGMVCEGGTAEKMRKTYESSLTPEQAGNFRERLRLSGAVQS